MGYLKLNQSIYMFCLQGSQQTIIGKVTLGYLELLEREHVL